MRNGRIIGRLIEWLYANRFVNLNFIYPFVHSFIHSFIHLFQFNILSNRKQKVNLTWKDLVDKKEDRAKMIEDSASIENFNELAGELEEFLKDRLNVLGTTN